MNVMGLLAQSRQLGKKLFPGRNWPVLETWQEVLSFRGIHGSSQVYASEEEQSQAKSRRRTGSTSANGETTCGPAQVENRKIIAKLLALDESDVNRIPVKLINEEKAQHTLEVLRTCILENSFQNFSFSASSVHQYPELLLMNGGAVENYIRIMQETMFPKVREIFILRFRTVCKQTLSVLQRKVSLPTDINSIVKQCCVEMGEDEAFFESVIKKLPPDSAKMTLFDLRNMMMAQYLTKLLCGTLNESFETFSKYPRMYYRCFNWVRRNYEILREFGFSSERIKGHSYLLHTDPNNLSSVIQLKSLAGLDFKKICNMRPKVLMSSCNTLVDIERSLMKYGIPYEYVQKYPEIFTLSSATIQQRLQEMDMVPEFQLLKTHPRVVRLLYYQNKAKSRLEEYRSLQMRVPSLHMLSSDTKTFSKSVSAGDFKVKGVDVILYLSEMLQVDRRRVRESLVRQPHWLHVPLINIKSVLGFLLSVGSFRTDQLVDALPLLLYPKDKIEEQMERVKKSGDAQPSDDFFLQMVLYYLEQPVHFTGDAVWPEKENHPEYEEDEGAATNQPSEGKQQS